jgi:hypothetical protein
MKLPKKIKLPSYIFKVKSLYRPNKIMLKNDWLAYVNYPKETINIAMAYKDGSSKGRSDIKRIFLHEIAHCLEREMNWGLKEEQIDLLGATLLYLMNKNKDLIKFIWK